MEFFRRGVADQTVGASSSGVGSAREVSLVRHMLGCIRLLSANRHEPGCAVPARRKYCGVTG
jgi:hypothetical protein